METNAAREKDQQQPNGSGGGRREPDPSRARTLSLEAPAARAAQSPSTIREMARDFGVSIRALRFYEDRGLLHPRREGTSRRYGARDRLRLKMILQGKQLGFTLSEIREILSSHREAADWPCAPSDRGSGRDPRLDSDAEPRAESGEASLEMGLPPDQIAAQISHLERRRKDLDEAIAALRDAHRRLLEAPRAAVG